MSTPGSINQLLIGAAGAAGAGYEISRSLRFNSADSAYLSRTPASAGNRKTWTWAGWVKRSGLGTSQYIFESRTGASDTTIMNLSFNASNQLQVVNYSYFPLISTPVYRDASAWYHIVWSLDTTQATASNRMKLYVNGTEITTFGTDDRSSLTQNSDQAINQAAVHYIGGQNYFSGYLADIHFIDGQALDPTSFTETDAITGQLVPIAYSGTYGTNGFHLPFSNNSTAAALGTDTSGNSNTWTVNNISVAAGSGNDSLVDTPSSTGVDAGNGGEVRGNYCTWNPLHGLGQTLSNGNLDASINSASGAWVAATLGVSSGKWYWEIPSGSGDRTLGVLSLPYSLTQRPYFNPAGYVYSSATGNKLNNSATGVAYGATYGDTDIIGVAMDLDAGTLTFYKNNVSQGVAFTGLSGTFCPVLTDRSSGTTITAVANFGQRPFAYTAPSGYKALCTTNLPDPVVAQPSTVMDVVTYTGNGSSPRTINGLNFSPDLVWIKNRANGGAWNVLFDVIRGGGQLSSNQTDAELAAGSNVAGYVSAYTSNGFTLTAGSSGINTVNENNSGHVAWTWDAGSSTVTNTQGSITSQVRANASAGFSIVTYTGNGTNGATVGHGLNVTPSMIITKDRDDATNWSVYHTSLASTHTLFLNTTDASTATAGGGYYGTVGSSTFALTQGSVNFFNLNNSGSGYVAYCFAPVAGYSSFGSYTGNSSTDGPFVYTGFRPRWILIKLADSLSTYPWEIYDTARSTYNVMNVTLAPNTSNSETGQPFPGLIDATANGFKIRSANATSYINYSAGTYIYAAFAENPFKYARAR